MKAADQKAALDKVLAELSDAYELAKKNVANAYDFDASPESRAAAFAFVAGICMGAVFKAHEDLQAVLE